MIKDFFGPGIIAGFTKPSLPDVRPLPFLAPDCKISSMRQTHSNRVSSVSAEGVYESDGIFTENKNHLLIVKTADCLPIILASRELNVIGVIHGGWRSLAGGILNNTPYKLDSFSVFLGPGLRECCYEAGREFLDYEIIKERLKVKRQSIYFDPVGFVSQKISGNIADSNICSFCSKEKFHSFRRDKTGRRTLSFIYGIKKNTSLSTAHQK